MLYCNIASPSNGNSPPQSIASFSLKITISFFYPILLQLRDLKKNSRQGQKVYFGKSPAQPLRMAGLSWWMKPEWVALEKDSEPASQKKGYRGIPVLFLYLHTRFSMVDYEFPWFGFQNSQELLRKDTEQRACSFLNHFYCRKQSSCYKWEANVTAFIIWRTIPLTF